MYPKDNCKKVQLPEYDKPGTLIKVRTDVSVATIDIIATYQGIFLPPKK